MQKQPDMTANHTRRNFIVTLRNSHWLSITLMVVAGMLLIGGIAILRTGRLADNFVTTVAVAPDGEVWIGTARDGVSIFDGQNWKSLTKANGLVSNEIEFIAIAETGVVWIATNNGVSRFDGDTWIAYSEKDGLASNKVRSITFGTNADVWFGTINGGASRFDGQTWVTYTPRDGLVDNDVRAIAIAADDVIWFGTPSGVSRYDNQTWTTYTHDDGLADDFVKSIVVTSDGFVWFGTQFGLSRFDGDFWSTYKDDDSWLNISSIAIAPDGDFWISIISDIYRFDGETWKKIGSPGNLFYLGEVAIAPDGSVWIGSNNGVFHFDGEKWTIYTESSGLPLGIGLIILAGILFGAGSLWIQKQSRSRRGVPELGEIHSAEAVNAIPISATQTQSKMRRDKMEIQTARKWYRWLWLSPFLTIPTLILLFIALDPYTYELVCPQGWNNCDYDTLYTLNGLIAVGFSSLWHLVLLIPSLNKKSEFVRWHGRQELILAGVRTAVPLIFVLAAGASNFVYISILILLPIWFFGTLWGQRQAARGDCSLMRWTGRENSIPEPPPEPKPDLAIERSPDELVDIIRFSDDSEQRGIALAELEKIGLVETLDEVTVPKQTSTSIEGVTEKKPSRRWILGVFLIAGVLVFALIMWGINQYQEVMRPEPTEISLTANDFSSDGDFHLRIGEYAEAVEDYRKTIALEPDHAHALNNLAWTLAYHLDTNYEEALDYAIRSVALDPDAASHDTLALVYFKLERYENALNHYNTALSMNPNQDSSYKGRGEVHLAMGDYESAVVDYEKYLSLNPDASDRNEIEKKIDSLKEE